MMASKKNDATIEAKQQENTSSAQVTEKPGVDSKVEHKLPDNKQSNKGLYFLLLILLLLIAIIFGIFVFQNGKRGVLVQSVDVERGYQPGPDVPLLIEKEVAEEAVIEQEAEKEGGNSKLRDLPKSSDKPAESALNKQKIIKDDELKYKAYFEYIENAGKMVTLFWLDQEYRSQLQFIQRYPLPADLEILMVKLERYNSYIDQEGAVKQLYFPQKDSFFSRFIRVYKISDDIYVKESLRQDIALKIEDLQDYFYSDAIKKQFKITE